AGKGTQALHLASHFGIPHISTGDIFRLNIKGETELGKLAKSYMDAGNLVPDSVTNEMVADRLTHDDAKSGFLLDGYPRNVGQADFLKEALVKAGTTLDAVLEFALANEEIIKRLSGRRTCRGCGGVSHVVFNAPKTAGVCDKCQGELYQREDDKEEVIAHRLDVYSEQTAPIIDYYRKTGLLKTISAIGEVNEIAERAIAALK
ncbi:MAG: adenylate kinase, partial [Actinomycetes bacterium]